MQYTIESDRLWKFVEELLVFPFPQICRHTVVCMLADAFMEKIHAEDPRFKSFCRHVVRADDDEALEMLYELREKDNMSTKEKKKDETGNL